MISFRKQRVKKVRVYGDERAFFFTSAGVKKYW